jgi:transposase
MTNFATYVDTTNDKAPITQRGKAKQKRADLRLVELGMVITRDGGIPLVAHAYPGNRPDITQLAAMIDLLVSRHTALVAALSTGPGDPAAPTPAQTISSRVTVAFDAGQNSLANSRIWPRPSWGSSASCTRIGSPA